MVNNNNNNNNNEYENRMIILTDLQPNLSLLLMISTLAAQNNYFDNVSQQIINNHIKYHYYPTPQNKNNINKHYYPPPITDNGEQHIDENNENENNNVCHPNGIYGIGIDFDKYLINTILQTRGCNYYSVKSSKHFEHIIL